MTINHVSQIYACHCLEKKQSNETKRKERRGLKCTSIFKNVREEKKKKKKNFCEMITEIRFFLFVAKVVNFYPFYNNLRKKIKQGNAQGWLDLIQQKFSVHTTTCKQHSSSHGQKKHEFHSFHLQ